MSQLQPDRAAVTSISHSGVGAVAGRSIPERSELVLSFARVLHVNGQSTHETVAAAEQLSGSLGLLATIVPNWEELQIKVADRGTESVSVEPGSPTGVHMERVASAMVAIAEVSSGRVAPGAALATIKAMAHAPPAPTGRFTMAAAAGAAALSVIFGVRHLSAVVLILLSAAGGALLRRSLGKYSTNTLVQPLCAALLAGFVGALAVRFDLSSSLRLVAVCPCMIFVPGSHFLYSLLDLSAAPIHLGICRPVSVL